MLGKCNVCMQFKNVYYDTDTVNQFICIDCVFEFDVIQAFSLYSQVS